jgi:hypothetical protein
MSSRRRPPIDATEASARRGADDATLERWFVDAGSADIATLEIPASAQRRRVFDVDVRFVVSAPAAGPPPWHAMTVELDGVQEWSRRIATRQGEPSDSLDHHCRREVGVGRALRVRVRTAVGGARRLRLVIEAEEQRA